MPGEDDKWQWTLSTLLVSRPDGVVPGSLRPQRQALIGDRFACVHLDRVRPHLDLGFGEGAQIVDPSRVAGISALRAHDKETAVIRHIGQRRGPPFSTLCSNMVQQQQRRRAPNVMADPVSGGPVDSYVNSHQAAQHWPAPIDQAPVLGHVSLLLLGSTRQFIAGCPSNPVVARCRPGEPIAVALSTIRVMA